MNSGSSLAYFWGTVIHCVSHHFISPNLSLEDVMHILRLRIKWLCNLKCFLISSDLSPAHTRCKSLEKLCRANLLSLCFLYQWIIKKMTIFSWCAHRDISSSDIFPETHMLANIYHISIVSPCWMWFSHAVKFPVHTNQKTHARMLPLYLVL